MDIVKVRPYKKLNIYLETDNYEYLKEVYQFFEYHVKDYQFMPRYQAGQWNGMKSVFRKSTRSLPYGLLTDLIRFTITQWKDEITLEVDDEVKKIFNSVLKFDPKWDLLYEPYYYQEETILSALQHKSGIYQLPTASGKSLCISYIIKELYLHTDQQLIIVPTIMLVKQFKDDMIDYGFDDKIIGMVDKDHKEFDSDIVVSTWQSLKNNNHELPRFQSITIDEVHGVRGNVLHDLLKKSPAEWRFGFTGTMPKDPLENLQVRSYLGPVLKRYKSSKLAKEGYIATCTINMLDIYHNVKYTGTYADVKNDVFDSPFRKNIIKSIVKNVDGSILILVDKIEKEGVVIEEYLKDQPELKDKQIMFLHGTHKNETRDYWKKQTHNEKNVVLIATFGIFQVGINVKSLQYAILGSSFKSSIRILQSIGRALRKNPNKEGKGAFIFDLNDQVKFLDKHGDERLNFYKEEEFKVNRIDVMEDKPHIDFKELY